MYKLPVVCVSFAHKRSIAVTQEFAREHAINWRKAFAEGVSPINKAASSALVMLGGEFGIEIYHRRAVLGCSDYHCFQNVNPDRIREISWSSLCEPWIRLEHKVLNLRERHQRGDCRRVRCTDGEYIFVIDSVLDVSDWQIETGL